jgi:hypothetical protein
MCYYNYNDKYINKNRRCNMGRVKMTEEEKRIYKTFTLSRDTTEALDRMKTSKRSSGILIDDAISLLERVENTNSKDDSYLFTGSMLDVYEKANELTEISGKHVYWKTVAMEALELYREKYARAERRKEKAEQQKKAEAKSRRGRKKADAVQ